MQRSCAANLNSCGFINAPPQIEHLVAIVFPLDFIYSGFLDIFYNLLYSYNHGILKHSL